MKYIKFIIPFVLIIAMICGGAVYVNDYSRAGETALSALESDGSVAVSEEVFGWYFDGPSTENALIFYPGGKVEETAYAPLLHKLAAQGVDVFLVKMPARLAFFGINKAFDITNNFNYGRWYIGGHSLGGVAASSYVSENPDDFDGIILLASYSTKELPSTLDALLIYGSLDGVLNRESYEENKKNLPADFTEEIIEGGNHAGFGSYGAQKGDNTAGIAPETQTDETVKAVINFIDGKNKTPEKPE
ncbi:MAG: alpha/beta hydrolase [Clostridia bacterium]|nr:alpha/beta hydrolase [Clostridia bacterium]